MRKPDTILIVFNDIDQSRALSEVLSQGGEFNAMIADSPDDATTLMEGQRIDLLLLDARFSDSDAVAELCDVMTRRQSRHPIVLLRDKTVRSRFVRRIEPFVEYQIEMPISLVNLLECIRSSLRSRSHSEWAGARLGGFLFEPAIRQLVAEDGSRVDLTDMEADTLGHLFRMAGIPVSREELLADVWGYKQNTATHTVETTVYCIRQKIETDPSRPRILRTVEGGYLLDV